jgi:hypothetical protein
VRKVKKKYRRYRSVYIKNANMVAKGLNARTVEGLPYANMVA